MGKMTASHDVLPKRQHLVGFYILHMYVYMHESLSLVPVFFTSGDQDTTHITRLINDSEQSV